jgi:hypothetical protein
MKSTADFDTSALECAVKAPGLGVRSARAIIGSVPHGFSLQNLARPLNDAEVNIGWFDLGILGDSEPQRRHALVPDKRDRTPHTGCPYRARPAIYFDFEVPRPILCGHLADEHQIWLGIAPADTAGKRSYGSSRYGSRLLIAEYWATHPLPGLIWLPRELTDPRLWSGGNLLRSHRPIRAKSWREQQQGTREGDSAHLRTLDPGWRRLSGRQLY